MLGYVDLSPMESPAGHGRLQARMTVSFPNTRASVRFVNRRLATRRVCVEPSKHRLSFVA